MMAYLIRAPKLLVINGILPYVKLRPASSVKCRLSKIILGTQDHIRGKSTHTESHLAVCIVAYGD